MLGQQNNARYCVDAVDAEEIKTSRSVAGFGAGVAREAKIQVGRKIAVRAGTCTTRPVETLFFFFSPSINVVVGRCQPRHRGTDHPLALRSPCERNEINNSALSARLLVTAGLSARMRAATAASVG